MNVPVIYNSLQSQQDVSFTNKSSNYTLCVHTCITCIQAVHACTQNHTQQLMDLSHYAHFTSSSIDFVAGLYHRLIVNYKTDTHW